MCQPIKRSLFCLTTLSLLCLTACGKEQSSPPLASTLRSDLPSKSTSPADSASASLASFSDSEKAFAELQTNTQYYQFDDDGNLLRPMNYREWIFAGTGTTPKSIYPDVLFPDFQNAYIDPYSFQIWKETGSFPDGTIIVKEMTKLGKTKSPVGKGFWQGDYTSLSAEVKSKSRFPDTHGNWNYFNWTNRAEEKLNDISPALGASCSKCHVANAPEGGVFYNYFAVLRDAKGFGKGAPENSDVRKGLQQKTE